MPCAWDGSPPSHQTGGCRAASARVQGSSRGPWSHQTARSALQNPFLEGWQRTKLNILPGCRCSDQLWHTARALQMGCQPERLCAEGSHLRHAGQHWRWDQLVFPRSSSQSLAQIPLTALLSFAEALPTNGVTTRTRTQGQIYFFPATSIPDISNKRSKKLGGQLPPSNCCDS